MCLGWEWVEGWLEGRTKLTQGLWRGVSGGGTDKRMARGDEGGSSGASPGGCDVAVWSRGEEGREKGVKEEMPWMFSSSRGGVRWR